MLHCLVKSTFSHWFLLSDIHNYIRKIHHAIQTNSTVTVHWNWTLFIISLLIILAQRCVHWNWTLFLMFLLIILSPAFCTWYQALIWHAICKAQLENSMDLSFLRATRCVLLSFSLLCRSNTRHYAKCRPHWSERSTEDPCTYWSHLGKQRLPDKS
jgi:hypothetical protein